MELETAAERLHRLLPWLNGRYSEDIFGPRARPEDVRTFTDYRAIRRDVGSFVRSFDGSAGAGFVRAAATDARDVEDDALGTLEAMLRILLDQGFGDAGMGDLSFPATSLRFAVSSTHRLKPGWRVSRTGRRDRIGGARAKRNFEASGAYVLRVEGPTVELVPFLVAHLLTQPGVVSVRRCMAEHGCDQLIFDATARVGRPRHLCVDAGCVAVRAQAKEDKKRRRK